MDFPLILCISRLVVDVFSSTTPSFLHSPVILPVLRTIDDSERLNTLRESTIGCGYCITSALSLPYAGLLKRCRQSQPSSPAHAICRGAPLFSSKFFLPMCFYYFANLCIFFIYCSPSSSMLTIFGVRMLTSVSTDGTTGSVVASTTRSVPRLKLLTISLPSGAGKRGQRSSRCALCLSCRSRGYFYPVNSLALRMQQPSACRLSGMRLTQRISNPTQMPPSTPLDRR